ncbi:MAG: hypothetical protein M3619_31540 [Myxococcota bacterium]|nr:hypothetical protein [Myxococcota bacterium]
MSITERCIVCRVSFRPQRAKQRLCGHADCRRAHHNRLARRRRRRDLERARALDRERQARRRERVREPATTQTAPSALPMSRARSDLEAVEMVQEIQKKLAGLGRCVARLSRATSTSQHTDHAAESGGFRG